MPWPDPVTSRRGFFWTGVERVESPFGTVVRGPMYVEWRRPSRSPSPIRSCSSTAAAARASTGCRPSTGARARAPLLVQRGYKVYVVDRPGHGRSSLHPDVIAPMGAPFPFEAGVGSSTRRPRPMSHPTAHLHTQWPGTGEDDDPALEAIVVSSGPMPELKALQALDQSRGAELLDRIGPAVVMAHSSAAPRGGSSPTPGPTSSRRWSRSRPSGRPSPSTRSLASRSTMG